MKDKNMYFTHLQARFLHINTRKQPAVMNRSIILSLLMMACFPLLMSAQTMEEHRPVIEIEGDQVINVGDVHSGDELHHSFTLKNVGDAPLVLQRICKNKGVSVNLSSRNASPGESIVLDVTVDTANRSGKSAASFVLQANTEQEAYEFKIVMNCLEKRKFGPVVKVKK